MIDPQGFRLNVGMIILNTQNQVFWAKRVFQDAWQFPQGGIKRGESAQEALFRELHEEVGLSPADVEILGQTKDWLRYRLPRRFIREGHPVCIGQKQRWFLLRMVGPDTHFSFASGVKPEFDDWKWVNYWYPLNQIVSFKREVYRRALLEFAPMLFESKFYNRDSEAL